jgi:hypothetical protein
VGEDIAFPIPTDWLDKKLDSTAYLRFIDESAWEVHVRVLQPILESLQFDKPQYDGNPPSPSPSPSPSLPHSPRRSWNTLPRSHFLTVPLLDTIICTPTLWKFCYKRLPKEAIGLFFAELKGLIKLMDLAKQTESILFSPNPNDPSSTSSLSSSHNNNNHTHQNYRSLREYYKVQSFKPSKLTFSYGEYRTLTIRGKQDPKPLIFSPR